MDVGKFPQSTTLFVNVGRFSKTMLILWNIENFKKTIWTVYFFLKNKSVTF